MDRISHGESALSVAICAQEIPFVELLLDAGAKLRTVTSTEIPDWIKGRQAVKRTLLHLIGVLRKRYQLPCAATQHIGLRIPRDVVSLIITCVWDTRFDSRWVF